MNCYTNTSLEGADDHIGTMPEIQFHLVTQHGMGETAGQNLAGAEKNPLEKLYGIVSTMTVQCFIRTWSHNGYIG